MGLQLSEWIGMGDWRLLFLHRDRLRTVTADDVRRVAAKYFKPSNRTLGVFVPTSQPDRVEIPSNPDLVSMLKDYKGGAAVAAGEAFDPSPKNIESRTARSTMAGLKLSLLPKQTRGDTVVANLTLRFGDEKSLMNRSMAGQFAGAMLMRGTTEADTPADSGRDRPPQGTSQCVRWSVQRRSSGRNHPGESARRCFVSWPRS